MGRKRWQEFASMTKTPTDDVTAILQAAQAGDANAAAQLLPLVYSELRKLAQDRLRACLRARPCSPPP